MQIVAGSGCLTRLLRAGRTISPLVPGSMWEHSPPLSLLALRILCRRQPCRRPPRRVAPSKQNVLNQCALNARHSMPDERFAESALSPLSTSQLPIARLRLVGGASTTAGIFTAGGLGGVPHSQSAGPHSVASA